MSLAKIQQEVIRLRTGEGEQDSRFLDLKKSIRVFQNRRLEKTYEDLLENETTAIAARFFLDYLYGVDNLTQRDQQAQRVLPKAEQYLPSSAVSVLTSVLKMDLLAEQMDSMLASELLRSQPQGEVVLTPVAYFEAFRAVGQPDIRLQQVQLVPEVGFALVKLLRFPMLSGLLSMTRAAAHKANLEDFHEFLYSGVKSFKTLKKPADFFQVIQNREEKLLSLIFEDGINDFPDYQSLS